MEQPQRSLAPETPVDDVRRVRRQLDQQFDGDIRRVAQHANEVTEELRDRLGLRPAPALPQARTSTDR